MPPLRSILKNKTGNPSSTPVRAGPRESLFPASKKDKRRIKHATLINKIEKRAIKQPRRRRPNRKLVATLEALADALPDDDDTDHSQGAVRIQSSAAGSRPEDQIHIIKRKSLKSRPGALKRREKLDRGERERFAKNMAQLTTPQPATDNDRHRGTTGTEEAGHTAVPATSERWAALRSFISQTLETKPELQHLAGGG